MDRRAVVAILRREPEFAELFIGCLLSRNLRIEEDLVGQIFSSSEERLARVLLVLAQFGKQPRSEGVIRRVSQGTLASMVGITRARVAYLMSRFRKLGFIHDDGGLQVKSTLLTVLLRD
jgi:CRP/FNR family transcriptional regulator, cyclic AMP receptor protein